MTTKMSRNLTDIPVLVFVSCKLENAFAHVFRGLVAALREECVILYHCKLLSAASPTLFRRSTSAFFWFNFVTYFPVV